MDLYKQLDEPRGGKATGAVAGVAMCLVQHVGKIKLQRETGVDGPQLKCQEGKMMKSTGTF